MAQVGCAGILVEDTFCGPLPALPPAGSLHLLNDMPVKAGGCAANVAIDLTKQDITVDIAGCLGNDPAAQLILNTLNTHNIDTTQITHTPHHTTSKTIILLIQGQDRRYLHVPGANQAFTVQHIPRPWLTTLKVFYLGGLFAMPGIDPTQLAELLQYCRKSNVTTVLDVVVPQHHTGLQDLRPLLPHIDVFLPNQDEATAFTGVTDPHDQLHTLQEAGANTVIITRGNQGLIAGRKGHTWTTGAYHMNTIDPSGSGDAFTSGIIHSLLHNWDMPKTLRYASAIGASATRAPGTTDAVFTAQEAQHFIQNHPLTVTEA